MSSIIGENIKINIFGQSHGPFIGATITNLPAGITIDIRKIYVELNKRKPSKNFNSSRKEVDYINFISGIYKTKTSGDPLTFIIKNNDVDSNEYDRYTKQPRPSHADFTSLYKYNGFNDIRGSGHLSGRLTVCLVIIGSIIKTILSNFIKNLHIYSHISCLNSFEDISYYQLRSKIIAKHFKLEKNSNNSKYLINFNSKKIKTFSKKLKKIKDKFSEAATRSDINIIDTHKINKILEIINDAKNNKDTLGGKIETVIFNLPAGLGDPLFNSFESTLSRILFSIGSIKGVLFGVGENFIKKRGNDLKDEILFIQKNNIITMNNYNGGINGGITNGEDIVFNTIIKPISSIAMEQYTYNIDEKKILPLLIKGRHDTTIVNRIIPVIEASSYIAIYDLFLNNKKILKDHKFKTIEKSEF